MKKKVIAWIAVAALSVSALTGCGSKGADDKTIKVAATAVPHAEILEAAKPLLEEQGYTLEVQVFDDYVQPNEVVESGEFDANYSKEKRNSKERSGRGRNGREKILCRQKK